MILKRKKAAGVALASMAFVVPFEFQDIDTDLFVRIDLPSRLSGHFTILNLATWAVFEWSSLTPVCPVDPDDIKVIV